MEYETQAEQMEAQYEQRLAYLRTRIAELEEREGESDAAIRAVAISLISDLGYPDAECDQEHPEVVLINLAIKRGLIIGATQEQPND